MQFDSYLFLLMFLPLTAVAHYLLCRGFSQRAAQGLLILASVVFYAWGNWKLAVFLAGWVLVNWLMFHLTKVLKARNSVRGSRFIGIVAICLNVGLLGYCKYASFFVESLNQLLKTSWVVTSVLLPVGISFLTFQQLAFIVDTMRGDIRDCSFCDYTLFFTYFPKVLSGPITLHNEFLGKRATFSWNNFARGSQLLAIGLGKKVLIADCVARVVNQAYQMEPAVLGTLGSLVTLLCYTFQIYFDFSGYSDMARGISLFYGYELPINFDSPYTALNIGDFWKRWHITLTRFLTRYIYIPLGGSRKGLARTCVNTLIVFFISGIWHGASQTFILWGLMHGVALVLYKLFKRRVDSWHPALGWILTFAFVNVTWAFFRADTPGAAIALLKQLAHPETSMPAALVSAFFSSGVTELISALGLQAKQAVLLFCSLALLLLLVLKKRNSNQLTNTKDFSVLHALGYALIMVCSICSFAGVSEFVYGAF